jgi:hypothetical protein
MSQQPSLPFLSINKCLHVYDPGVDGVHGEWAGPAPAFYGLLHQTAFLSLRGDLEKLQNEQKC